MKNKEEVEKLLDIVMKQYQRTGAIDWPNTPMGHIWQQEILDRCSAAIDVLSWVLNDDGLDYRITGENCNPAIPLDGLSKKDKKGYESYLKLLQDY